MMRLQQVEGERECTNLPRKAENQEADSADRHVDFLKLQRTLEEHILYQAGSRQFKIKC